MEVDRKARLLNHGLLRELSVNHTEEVSLFCSQDAVEFQAFVKENYVAQPH